METKLIAVSLFLLAAMKCVKFLSDKKWNKMNNDNLIQILNSYSNCEY